MLRLNFCVRYGNRWNPQAIITGNCMRGLVSAGRSGCSGYSSLSNVQTSRTISLIECSGLLDDQPYWTSRLIGFADSHPLSRLPYWPSDSLSSVGFALAFLCTLRFSDSLTLFALPSTQHTLKTAQGVDLTKLRLRLLDQALDRLVSSSCTHYCASTDDLSTSSSLRGLTCYLQWQFYSPGGLHA